nr:PREDICTED: peptidoglycan-recognition protein SC2 [Megachile rotundata]
MNMVKLTITLLVAAVCLLGVSADIHVFARPNIVSRVEWGARSANEPVTTITRTPSFVIIHHSAGAPCMSKSACSTQVKNYQNQHINTNHWSDIGYNFLVGEDGNVYEGRGWGKVGAHAPNYNSKSIGICVMGNYMNRNPNSAAISAVKNLIQYGVDLGKITSNYKLLGHRQTKATSCPGDTFYRLIQSWPHWSSSA